ncbi:hypothetical protein GCM10027294_09190 [Marinactinospora endophytica]
MGVGGAGGQQHENERGDRGGGEQFTLQRHGGFLIVMRRYFRSDGLLLRRENGMESGGKGRAFPGEKVVAGLLARWGTLLRGFSTPLDFPEKR